MPYGGIYFVIREFLLQMAPVIDGYLGLRSTLIGYQYSEIMLAMLCNFCCGGERTEDIYRIHDMIEQKPGLRICSPDTVLRAMRELPVEDTVYTSQSGKEYRFNTAECLNGLLVYAAVKSAGALLDLFEEGGDDVYVYRAILTNEWDMTEEDVIEFYNLRGEGRQARHSDAVHGQQCLCATLC